MTGQQFAAWCGILLIFVAIATLLYPRPVPAGRARRASTRRKAGARDDESPMSSLGYTKLWEIPFNKNFISLMIGLIVSGMIVVAAGLVLLALPLFLLRDQPPILFLAAFVVGAFLAYAPAAAFFKAGRFDVLPGQTAYISLFKIPITEMQVGEAWIFPRVMSSKIVDSQAVTVVNELETFMTGNGANVNAKMSATPHIFDPLRFQKLQEDPTNVKTTVGRLLSTKTRAYISTQTVNLAQVGILETLNPQGQWDFVQQVTGFKGIVARNGPEAIRALLNKDLADYGLWVEEGQVQVDKLSLDEVVEKAINRILAEIFEKIALPNDARNKVAVAQVLFDGMKAAGIKVSNLSQDTLLELFRENLDRALASEDKAQVKAFHFRGRAPRGVMINSAD